jgi:hypothetical protein
MNEPEVLDADVVDATHAPEAPDEPQPQPSVALAVVDNSAGAIIRADQPEEILAKAHQIAKPLANLIESAGLAANVGGRRKHVEVGGWQACGTLLGALGGQPLHAETIWTRPVSGRGRATTARSTPRPSTTSSGSTDQKQLANTTTYEVDGFDWEACVEIRTPSGVVVGRAEAMVARRGEVEPPRRLRAPVDGRDARGVAGVAEGDRLDRASRRVQPDAGRGDGPHAGRPSPRARRSVPELPRSTGSASARRSCSLLDWAKLDDSFWMHPKTLMVGNTSAGIFARMLSYCGCYLTDGLVPAAVVALIVGSDKKALQALIDQDMVELWESGSVHIPHYLEFNRSKRDVEADRKMRAKNGARRPTEERSMNRLGNLLGYRPGSDSLSKPDTGQVRSS